MMHAWVWNTGRFAHPAYLYGGMHWWMIVTLVAVAIALVLSIIAFVRTSRHQIKRGNDEALTILAQRYAKGELAKDEYEAMKKDLRE